jgi:cytoskeleton protein RodZ
MGSFGEKLRREREMRGITLDQIAAATKIGTRSLKALEDENFAILPGGIFNKGFVRAYARFLGLNEDEAVAGYQSAANDQPISVKQIAAQSAIAKANRLAAQQARESRNAAGVVRAFVMFVVVAAVAFGGYWSFRRGYFAALRHPSLHRQLKQQAQAPAKPYESVVTLPSAQPAQSAPKTEPPALAATPAVASPVAMSTVAAEFTVSIKTSDQSWLSVMADGKRAVERLFAANEQQSVTARNRVRIRVGNPSATELSLNGKPLAIAGDLTHPRTIVVDASGITAEYAASPCNSTLRRRHSPPISLSLTPRFGNLLSGQTTALPSSAAPRDVSKLL